MFRRSLVSLSVCAFVFSACGSGKGSKSNPKNPDQYPHVRDDDDDDDYTNEKSISSDIDNNMRVPRCVDGKSFAFGKCWDSIFISDQGEISLINGSEKEVLFNKKTQHISPLIGKYYSYTEESYTSYDAMIVENPVMAPYREMSSFWFLPARFDLTDPLFNHEIKNNILTNGSFNLIEAELFHVDSNNEWVPMTYHEFKGMIQIKGRMYSLPITQKTLEDVCLDGVPFGDNWPPLICKLDDNITFKFFLIRKPDDHGTDPKWTQRRVANRIEISMKQKN